MDAIGLQKPAFFYSKKGGKSLALKCGSQRTVQLNVLGLLAGQQFEHNDFFPINATRLLVGTTYLLVYHEPH